MVLLRKYDDDAESHHDGHTKKAEPRGPKESAQVSAQDYGVVDTAIRCFPEEVHLSNSILCDLAKIPEA